MLFVKRLALIDSAEEQGQWLSRAKRQWGVSSPLAVRVKRNDSTTLGSTIPKEMTYNAAQDHWCASWLEATEVPLDPAAPAGVEPAEAANRSPVEDPGTRPLATDVPEEAADDDAAADTPTASEGEGNADASGGEESDSGPASAEAVANNGAASDGEGSRTAPLDAQAPHDDDTPATPPEQRGTPSELVNIVDDLVGIDVSTSAKDGFVVFEVITLSGGVKCTAIANIASALRGDPVQHFTVVLTPTCTAAVDDSTVHGVLEFTVAQKGWLSEQSESPSALVRFPANAPVPTTTRTPAVAFSTRDLYFPTTFLTGTGAFVVSNVVCIENLSSQEVSAEFVVTGDSHLIKVSPPTASLRGRGDRAFFVCTWNLFKPFVVRPRDDAGSSVKVHALLREGAESLPSVDFNMHAELPRAGETNPSFLFWVNTTMITNAPCGEQDKAAIRDRLPVYAIQKKAATDAMGSAERPTYTPPTP